MIRNTLTLLLLAASLSGCRNHEPAVKPQPAAVRTVAARMIEEANETKYAGVVAPETQAELAFRMAGYIEQIGMVGGRELQEGDYVAAGAVLARMRPTEYQARADYAKAVSADANAALAALQAQLSEAEAGLAQAASDFGRARTLFGEKALPKADFDAAETKRSTAAARRSAIAAQVVSQQARIDGAKSQEREASLTLADTVLTAPFPGVIVAKRIARGSLASAGIAAFILADTRLAKVSFGVPDSALTNLRPGGTLRVVAEAMPDREFQGRIGLVAPAADPTSRVFAVEALIPNREQSLKIGMVATVIVAGPREAPTAPAIPLAAVVRSAAGYGVYTVENNRAKLQPVTLGPVKGNDVTILAGLNAGQRVIATGGLQLADGEEVRQIP